MKLSDKAYDILKLVALVVLYGLSLIVCLVGNRIGLPDDVIKIVSGVLAAAGTALGGLLGLSSANYYKDKQEAQEEPEEPSEPAGEAPVAVIYLSPSQQSGNKYAYGNTNERDQCEKIAEAAAKSLMSHNFKVYLEPKTDVTLRVVNAVQAGDVDWYIPIHTNAFDGKVAGTRLMIRAFDTPDEEMADFLMRYLDELLPGTSSNTTAHGDKWFEQRLTDPIPSVYIEADFHDVPDVAKFIVEHTTEIGEAIAHGICEYYGVRW